MCIHNNTNVLEHGFEDIETITEMAEVNGTLTPSKSKDLMKIEVEEFEVARVYSLLISMTYYDPYVPILCQEHVVESGVLSNQDLPVCMFCSS